MISCLPKSPILSTPYVAAISMSFSGDLAFSDLSSNTTSELLLISFFSSP